MSDLHEASLIENLRRLVAGEITRSTCGPVVIERDAWWQAKLSTSAAKQLLAEIDRLQAEIERLCAEIDRLEDDAIYVDEEGNWADPPEEIKAAMRLQDGI